MIDRWNESYNVWNSDDDYIEVSVPEGLDGDPIRKIIKRACMNGKVTAEFSKGKWFHSDGRWYRIAYLRGYNAREIANECISEQAELSDLLDKKAAQNIAQHKDEK